MKINKYFLSLAAASMLFAACGTDDLELGDSTTAPVSADCPSVEFASTTNTNVEVDPSYTKFDITVVRRDSAAAEYNIMVEQNDNNVFDVPSKVSFAQGEKEKDITVNIKEGTALGETFNLKLTFDDEKLLNPYTVGYKELSLKATIIKWESYGKGYWIDNVIPPTFGINPVPLVVELEKAVTPNSTRYRFTSPYCTAGEDTDELGAYTTYPYNEAGDLTGSQEKAVISINSSNAASMSPTAMGNDWGYGEMSMGSIYGNLSTNIASYPLGTFTATEGGGKIVFPANSLYLSLPSWGTAMAGECTLYLSADDFKASDYYSDGQSGNDDDSTSGEE